jgi:methionine-rich copper-binding protein CopC
LLIASAVASLFAFLLVTVAHAHAEYDRSTPPAGGEAASAPESVDIWFTQELFRRAGANTIEVIGPGGTRVDLGETVLDDADRTHLSVGLQPDLSPGEYTVRWTNLSAVDDEANAGEFSFRIDPDAPPAATEAAGDQGSSLDTPEARNQPELEAGDDGGTPGWTLFAVFALVGVAIVGVAGFALLRLRSTPGG